MEERILALDVGEKRIGVAVSDPLGITAQGVETIFSQGVERDLARVKQIADAYGARRILLGDPKLLSGGRGAQAQKTDLFMERLKLMGFETRAQDERLTSVSAERVLIGAGVRREARRKVIDKLAATLILQAFLDAGGWREASKTRQYGKEVFRLMDGYMDSDNCVELVDEDGKQAKFTHVMTLEYEGSNYVLLSPAEPMEDIAEDEVMILRIAQDQEGVDVYVSVDDDAELENVFAKYLSIAEQDDDEDEAPTDDDE